MKMSQSYSTFDTISPILAAVFSSVPKAYNKENLAIYLENRTLKYNNARLNDIVLDNLNMKRNSNYIDNDSESFRIFPNLSESFLNGRSFFYTILLGIE